MQDMYVMRLAQEEAGQTDYTPHHLHQSRCRI